MSGSPVGKAPYKRIATEEAFATAEMFKLYRNLLERGVDSPAFQSLWGFYLLSKAERPRQIIERLLDLGDRRLSDMDTTGVDMQILSLTAPGVQVLGTDAAKALSISANDELAEAIARHPARFAGLAAFAPQDPRHAAKELERGVAKLGLKGGILNSHVNDEYLDDPKFWTIFEAAESLDVPIYLHPSGPSKGLIQPMLEKGLDGAIFGFGVDTALHALRLIVAGVFDRFPRLKLVLGHLGEALPFWLYRLDYMHRATVSSNRYESMKPLRKKPSDYMRENVYVTTSGMAWEPAIKFCQDVLGLDRVLYAMDYPYEFVAQEVVTQDNLSISLEDRTKFFQTNAEKLFKLT